MKLLNREPTEEMIKAAYVNYEHESYTGYTSIFQAMYDAAPEIKVGMEPVAIVDESDEGLFIEICYDENGSNLKLGDKLYSAEQVATLLSEQDYEYNRKTNNLIERHVEKVATLQAEIEELEHIRKDLLARNYKLEAESYVVSEFNKMIEKTNDKLVTAIQNVKDVKGRYHTERAMLAMFKLLEKE